MITTAALTAATQPPPEMEAIGQFVGYLPVVPLVLSFLALLMAAWSYIGAGAVEHTTLHTDFYDHRRFGHAMMVTSVALLFLGTPLAVLAASSFAAQMPPG